MVPYHGDALLPTEQRYSSELFRRLHRFKPSKLSVSEGAELISFVDMVGLKVAKMLFEWDAQTLANYERVAANEAMVLKSKAFIQANEAAMDAETGLAVLDRMIERGFRRGNVPVVVRRALQTRRGHGESAKAMAIGYRVLGKDQIQGWMTPRPRKLSGKALLAKMRTRLSIA